MGVERPSQARARTVCETRTRTRSLGVGVIASFASVAFIALSEQSAFAQPSSPGPRPEVELIRIDYTADARCPRFETFVERVRAYTSRWKLAEDGEGGRRFRLKLEPRAGRVVGTLEVVSVSANGSDPSGLRTITGPDCETVARGMAVAVAVAIDPAALLGEPPVAKEEEPPPPPVPPAPPPPKIDRPRLALRPAPRRRTTPRFAMDAGIELTSAVVVGYLPVFDLALEIEPLPERGPESSWPRWLRPSLAVGVRQSVPKGVERSTVTTDFLWSAALFRLCPVRFVAVRDRFEVMPCVEGNVGVLRAEASGSSDARSSTKLWLDGGLSARATWTVAGPWFVDGGIAMVLPLSRNRFELADGVLVSRAPRVGMSVGVGGGIRF